MKGKQDEFTHWFEWKVLFVFSFDSEPKNDSTLGDDSDDDDDDDTRSNTKADKMRR